MSSSSYNFDDNVLKGGCNPDEVFDQLSDMFGMMATVEVIMDVGHTNNWKLEECIESMINYSNNNQLPEPTTLSSTVQNIDMPHAAKHHNGLHFESATNGLVDAPPPWTPFNQNSYNGASPKTPSYRSTNQNHTFQSPNVPKAPLASSFLKHGANHFTETPRPKPKHSKFTEPMCAPVEVTECIQQIERGFKVMVIMRGAPGSGKSHLARYILSQSVRNAMPSNHIFSADDYFMRNGSYQYESQYVPDAHEANQRNVRRQTGLGWSPIIVDNTMIRVWEMHDYIDMAVRNGYVIRILESTTPWRRSASQLTQRNIHGVSRQSIERMLRSFEDTTLEAILKNPQFTYSVNIPQMRDFPPLEYPPETVAQQKPNSSPLVNALKYPPKPQRIRTPDIQPAAKEKKEEESAAVSETTSTSKIQDPKDTFLLAAQKLQELGNTWRSYEKESGDFWTGRPPLTSTQTPSPKTLANGPVTNNMIDLLRDDKTASAAPTHDPAILSSKISTLHKHRPDCPNEHPVFAHIRQIYPAVPGAYLWDLFKHCNGDPEWTLDILLKEGTRVEQFEEFNASDRELCCDCDRSVELDSVSSEGDENITILKAPPTAPALKLTKRDRMAYQNLELRKQIEDSIVIDDTHYTEHTRKIRNIRYGVNQVSETNPLSVEWSGPQSSTDSEAISQQELLSSSPEDLDSPDVNSNNNEFIEINLGKEIIGQLESLLGLETIPTEKIVDLNSLKTNVFMPRVLAQQLYALWMESMYNQLEEQRLQTVRADEEFARQLFVQQQQQQQVASASVVQPPKMSIKDVVEMECAWANYNAQLPGDAWRGPTDLATKMTYEKLGEAFPDIEADTLRDVLEANNNQFQPTVDMLNRMLPAGKSEDDEIAKTKQELLNRAQIESEKVDSEREERYPSMESSKKLDPSEAKHNAMLTFEECRNQAIHHSQMKAECYQKCKAAMQRGEGSVALYYSHVAHLHKSRIDHFNHLASNCIMEVHNLTQTSPDILDLHYLYVTEAIECLDIFLDQHLSRLRAAPQPYKTLHIITGRGLHSTGGFSTIKQRSKSRLKDRGLSWSEVNPGLLRVKIYPNSYLSMDVK